jgi:hypothetical protein
MMDFYLKNTNEDEFYQGLGILLASSRDILWLTWFTNKFIEYYTIIILKFAVLV